MWIADGWKDYELLDCGGGEKLERWGKQILVRPDPQAIWETAHRTTARWRMADARYQPLRRRAAGTGTSGSCPSSWHDPVRGADVSASSP